MEDKLEGIEIPQEILDLIAGGTIPGDEKETMNHYVETFKAHDLN